MSSAIRLFFWSPLGAAAPGPTLNFLEAPPAAAAAGFFFSSLGMDLMIESINPVKNLKNS